MAAVIPQEEGREGNDYHVPVLFRETMDLLQVVPDGIYVDCTFGGGGHSRGILKQLGAKGRLIAFDQDADARVNLPDDERVIFVPQNFRYLHRFLKLYGMEQVNGILADLGVSSHQFDEGKRGFSIRFDGPLDMRMDRNSDTTARDILMDYDAAQLQQLFSRYGEVTNARTLAKHIEQYRSAAALDTVSSFRHLIDPVIKGNPNKYLAQVFQALRIEVNNELGVLEEMLEQVPDVLVGGGRVALITFHSLEDRIVKNFFRKGTLKEEPENPFLNNEQENPLRIITRKPVVPGEEEQKRNPRSRSAKLRVAEKKEKE